MATCDDCWQHVIRMGESQPICWFADQQADDYPDVVAYRDANQGGDMSQCPQFQLDTPSNSKPVLRMQPMTDGGPRMPYRSTVRWMESLWALPLDTDDTQTTED